MFKIINKNKFIIIISSILIVNYAIFAVYPLIFNIITSLRKTNFIDQDKFVGLFNYKSIIADSVFWASIRNNLIYTAATVVVGIIIALILASLIHYSGRKSRRIFTAIYFLPAVTSTIALSLVWKVMYIPNVGIFSKLLYEWFNIGPLKFLSDPKLALASIILMSLWQVAGFDAVIFMAGMNEIPDALYDAAMLDGVTPWSRFFRIVVPLLRPQIVFVLAIRTIFGFLVFGQFYMLADPKIGMPGSSTWILLGYIWAASFEQLRFGRSTTVALVLTVILMGLVIFQTKALQFKYEY